MKERLTREQPVAVNGMPVNPTMVLSRWRTSLVSLENLCTLNP